MEDAGSTDRPAAIAVYAPGDRAVCAKVNNCGCRMTWRGEYHRSCLRHNPMIPQHRLRLAPRPPLQPLNPLLALLPLRPA